MDKTAKTTSSLIIISTSCLLSLLCFIPAPVDLNYSQALLSGNVFTSFLCAAVASFPMFLDCWWDILSKLKWIRIGSSRDHSYLMERWFIFVGFIYPTVGYFASVAANPNHVGIYYMAVSSSQSVWLGGAYLTILHSAKRSIWTLQWCLSIMICVVGSNLSSLFLSAGVSTRVLYYLFIVAAATMFIYLYGKTIISVRRKAVIENCSMPSADYFCLVYVTLTLFNFIVQLVITSIMHEAYGDEVSIIYTNIAAIICITLANMVPNRREEEINLESTELSLAMKQAFVRYLSHEMRTPINVALVGLLMHQQYLEERELFSEECKETLADVKGAVDVALETLNEALNYEKLQSKVMALDKTREDPLSFVLSSTSMFKAPALNAGVSLILPEAAEVSWLKNSWIDIDIRKMSQVMRNLMSNALKFTPMGGSITVAMRTAESPLAIEEDFLCRIGSMFSDRLTHSAPDPWLEISVQDQGVGIEAEYLPRIFNEVLQINPNKNQGGHGTGMGLYISKGIAELHGGRVEVDSAGLGQGSCFKILLPLHLATSPTATSVGEGTLHHGAQPSLDEPDKEENVVGDRVATVDSESQMKLLSDTETKIDHGSHIGESADATARSLPAPELRDHRAGNDDTVNASASVKDSNKELQQQPRSAVVPGILSGKGLTSNSRLLGQRVLMVDDSPTNLKMCVKLLQRLGAVVDQAEDGRIAVTMVQALLPPLPEQTPPPPILDGVDCSSSPQVILPTYIGQLPYTTPDELNNVRSSVKQLNLTDIHGKQFSSLPPGVLFKARRKEESDSFILSPRNGHVNITVSSGGKNNCEGKGYVIQSNSGRRVVTVDEYIQLAVQWQAMAVIALADEICAESCTRKRMLKAMERSKQWFLDCRRLLQPSPSDSTANVYSPLLFGVPIFNRFDPDTYKDAINWLIDSGATGIVVSCHMGEGSTLRKQMIAQARIITSARGIPIAIQGCDTLEHIADAIEVGVDLVSTNLPQLLTGEGRAISLSFDTVVTTAIGQTAEMCQPTLSESKYKHSINLWESAYERDVAPLVSGCGCHACMYYSRAYIHHLLQSKEMLAEVLLYNHNQYQMVELFQIAKDKKNNGSLSQWLRSFS
eukprot:gene28731-37725_t